MRINSAFKKLGRYAKDGQNYSVEINMSSWQPRSRYSLYLEAREGIEAIATMYKDSWEKAFLEIDQLITITEREDFTQEKQRAERE